LLGPSRASIANFRFECQTAKTSARPLAARIAPELCIECCPREERGRRESRVLSKHPQPRTQTKKRTSVVATGSPKQSGLPCAMVYGLFRALPGDRAFLPPSLADRPANLTPASGRRDHTALPSATASFVLRHQSVHRIPHPTFVGARDKRQDGADLGSSAMTSPCDKSTRRAICAWRACANCRSCKISSSHRTAACGKPIASQRDRQTAMRGLDIASRRKANAISPLAR
jgi:hypothetical protein